VARGVSMGVSVLNEKAWARHTFPHLVTKALKERVCAASWLLNARSVANRALVVTGWAGFALGAGCRLVQLGGSPGVGLLAFRDEVKVALAVGWN